MAQPTGYSDVILLLTTMLLRMIKMIIAPLIFATLVVGIAKMGNVNEVGRVGGKALGWFIIASLISLTLGLIMVNLFAYGALKLTRRQYLEPVPKRARCNQVAPAAHTHDVEV